MDILGGRIPHIDHGEPILPGVEARLIALKDVSRPNTAFEMVQEDVFSSLRTMFKNCQ